MAITYGFYNSINNDRVYDAEDFASIFDGIVNDGVYMGIGDKFATTPGGAGLKINVGTGRGWFRHTWIYNSLPISYTLAVANSIYNRIDAIFIKINKDARENSLEVVTGTPSSSPVKPTRQDTATVFYYPISYITVRAGATTISSGDIENVVGSNKTPWVNGIIETVSIEHLVNNVWQPEFDTFLSTKNTDYVDWKSDKEEDHDNWVNQMQDNYNAFVAQIESEMESWMATEQAAFDAWTSQSQSDYNTWINQMQTNYNNWVTAEEIAYNNWISQKQLEYETWFQESNDEFDNWFQHLHDELDENQAAHLQNEIDNLQTEIDNVVENEFKHYLGLCTVTGVITHDSNGDITSITSTDTDESITCVTDFTIDGDSEITTQTISIQGKSFDYVRTITISGSGYTDSYQTVERGGGS